METQPKPKNQPRHMDRTITTLHEYRLRYPDSAAIPTLTQSGLLGLILYRQDLKAARLARRRAMWRRVRAAPHRACAGIWRALITPQLRRSANHVEVATGSQA
jgi:hypothetical protein